MSIESPEDFEGLSRAGAVVAATLKTMMHAVRAGVTTGGGRSGRRTGAQKIRGKVRASADLRFSQALISSASTMRSCTGFLVTGCSDRVTL